MPPPAERPTHRLALANAAGRLASLALQLAHFAVLARAFGPDDFGSFAAGLALASMVGVAAELGLPTTVLIERATDDRSTVWSRALAAVLVTSAVAVVIGAMVATVVLRAGARLAALMLLGWVVAARIRLVAVAVRQADYHTGRAVASELTARSVALAGAGAGAVAVTGAGPLTATIAAALVAGDLAGTAVAWPARPRPVHRREVLDLIGRSRDFGLTAAAASVHSRVDQVLLSSFGAGRGGPYAVAYRLVDAALAIATAVTAAAVPLLGRCQPDERERLARALTAAAAVFALATAVVLVAAAPVLVSVVGGPGYDDAVDLVRILALVLVVAVVNVPLLHLLVVEGRSRLLFRLALAMVACNAGLNMVAIPRAGATGAALATLASEIVGLVVVTATARRLHRRVLPGWRPWRDLAPLRNPPAALAHRPLPSDENAAPAAQDLPRRADLD